MTELSVNQYDPSMFLLNADTDPSIRLWLKNIVRDQRWMVFEGTRKDAKASKFSQIPPKRSLCPGHHGRNSFAFTNILL